MGHHQRSHLVNLRHAHWQDQQVLRPVEQEGLVVVQHRRIGPPVADFVLGDLLWVGHIADIEERYLDALVPGEIALVCGRSFPMPITWFSS